jgi:class 3 adenylate cyclase
MDRNGEVWIGTNKGLNKWRPNKGSFVAYTERAGFTGIEVKPHAVCSTRDGDIWFGTVNGATRVGGRSDRDLTVAPIVAIRGWKVNLEDRPIEAGVKLGHTERNLHIAYGSVALSDPGAVRYMHRLEGLEEDWQPITTATDAHYPALPPGKYVFQVKAMDRSGVWSDPPAELRFTILPPWYRSWWFYTALALVLGISLISYIKVRERQLKLRNQILERKVEERTAEVVAQSKEIEGQKVRIEDLLLNILPKPISDELKEKGRATARRHDDVTVMFTDMKGFTKAAEKMTPEQLVNELDECFIGFDEIIGRYGIEKIKTIGDSYMCACGVPSPDTAHAIKVLLAGLEVRTLMDQWRQLREARGEHPWVLRIGVHSGPVVAGVVGKRKFAYDIWGDTVNTASRMESSGEPGEVNISGTTYELVKDLFICEHRGKVEAKNKGQIDMYFVRRIRPEYSADAEGSKANAQLLDQLGVSAAEQFA